MSNLNVLKVVVLNYKTPFLANIDFDIHFEVLQPITNGKNIHSLSLR